MRRQRGVALLAVSLLLMVLGALAFIMGRQSAMATNAVNAQYDTEVARYLAEAGLNVAKWHDLETNCKKTTTIVPPSRIDAGGTYSASIINGGKNLNINAVGATDAGARVSMSRPNVVAHENVVRQLVIANDKQIDTFISRDTPFAQGGQQYLELTQGRSSALMQFTLPSELTQAIIVRADLTMTQYQSNSVLPAQVVSAHRLTRNWSAGSATWAFAALLSPWSNNGADYTPGNATATAVNGNNTYKWDVTSLVDGWANNAFPNNGLLLLADGPLQQARFYSFESALNKPTLLVTYYKAC